MDHNEKDNCIVSDINNWRIRACHILNYSPRKPNRKTESIVSFAKRIEHTLLKTDAREQDVIQLCSEARAGGFRSVCCLPRDVSPCRALLDESGVLVVTVVNFPLAGSAAGVMEYECGRVIQDGADEIDMVVDIRALRAGDLGTVRDGVARVVEAASGHVVKAILETSFLTQRQIVEGSLAAEAGGAVYVKTSTGFGPRGANVEDVTSMRAAVEDRVGIKAAGGIRDHTFAAKLVEVGADLIGTSSGLQCLPPNAH